MYAVADSVAECPFWVMVTETVTSLVEMRLDRVAALGRDATAGDVAGVLGGHRPCIAVRAVSGNG
jgi:hypothetical protein